MANESARGTETMKKYTVRSGADQFCVALHDANSILIDDRKIEYSVSPIKKNFFLLRFENTSFEVFIPAAGKSSDENITVVFINGHRFEVELENERKSLMRKYNLSATESSSQKRIVAPMPGLITKILIREGQSISSGQGLIVLEAMKMENELKATIAGTIRSIKVHEKDPVEKNTVLIELA